MNFTEYIESASTTAIYPGRGTTEGLGYVISGLAGELGECFEVLKKVIRDDGGVFTEKTYNRFKSEVGDVFWYISQVIFETNSKSESDCKEVDEIQNLCYTQYLKSKTGQDTSLNLLQKQRFFLASAHHIIDEMLISLIEIEVNGKDTESIDINIGKLHTVLMIFLANINISIEETLQKNLNKLSDRKSANKLKGSGETIEER